ncbi:DNA-dependent RNA polymerase subunit epsilon [Ectobacillus ponti]|uniref:DNA-directed RNA polymerase subunit epsilon n=1 Tax=Ectobacillus ponti TaxID=2961894 RepID=A0AA41XDX2_9BACI|nr:DNA-directed RNA polymerase subunit epsilon [Ectobacillus ponti]MCP8970321.1 DNA-directed RNA polymerase subunit epsilon [Ectobacillus ponti]
MIFKVFYQQLASEVPVREKTQVLYVEAESERQVRTKLAPYKYNIELVQALSEAHLAYEQQSPQFKIMENV